MPNMFNSKNEFEPKLKKQRQLSILDLFPPISNFKTLEAKNNPKVHQASSPLGKQIVETTQQEEPPSIHESRMNLQKPIIKSLKQARLLSCGSSTFFSSNISDSGTVKGGLSSSCPSALLEALDRSETIMSGSPKTCNNASENLSASTSPLHPDKLLSGKKQSNLHDDDLSVAASPINVETGPSSSSLLESESFEVQEYHEQTKLPAMNVPAWIGMPHDQLKTMPSCSSLLPELAPTADHAVLFNEKYKDAGSPPPLYKDAWDSNHVRLPCSPKNLYPVRRSGDEETLASRWELIESSVLMDMQSSIDLEECILNYNSRYSNQWKFRALHKFFTEDVETEYANRFFRKTLPAMVSLALMLPMLCTEPIPLLRRQRGSKLTMTQQQIACLLCNAFLCTFPWRNSRRRNSEYANFPDINFSRLFTCKAEGTSEKLKTLIHYFERVTNEMPTGTVTFERRAIDSFPLWDRSPCTLCGLRLDSQGRIEKEGAGMLQVDFANKFIGGGVLGYGLVQEEIRFLICPELIVSTLFTERMDDNETVVITGVEQYSTCSGYGNTYHWTGDYIDNSPRDLWGRRITQVVAMDALRFDGPSSTQYVLANVRRELNKAFSAFFCDFDPDHAPAIATGNWGCGVFGGNPILKGLIQLMAAAALGRDLCYFTFNDSELLMTLHKMHSYIQENNLQICDLWQIIAKYKKEVINSNNNEDLFEFMQRIHSQYNESTDEE